MKNYLKMESLKIGILENDLRIRVLKIKFENWHFEKLFENGILKIGILKNCLRIGVLKIKFEKWYFEKLFENRILKI